MKTKRPLQSEPEWQEEEMRLSVARLFLPVWPERPGGTPPGPRARTPPGRKGTMAVAGRHRAGAARRARGFTMPASDASLWVDEIEGD